MVPLAPGSGSCSNSGTMQGFLLCPWWGVMLTATACRLVHQVRTSRNQGDADGSTLQHYFKESILEPTQHPSPIFIFFLKKKKTNKLLIDKTQNCWLKQKRKVLGNLQVDTHTAQPSVLVRVQDSSCLSRPWETVHVCPGVQSHFSLTLLKSPDPQPYKSWKSF